MRTERMKTVQRMTRKRATGSARAWIPWPSAALLIALAWLAPGCGEPDPEGQQFQTALRTLPWNGGAMACNTVYTIKGFGEAESCAGAINTANAELGLMLYTARNACWAASGWKGTLYADLPRAKPASGVCDELEQSVFHDEASPSLELIYFWHSVYQDVFCMCPSPPIQHLRYPSTSRPAAIRSTSSTRGATCCLIRRSNKTSSTPQRPTSIRSSPGPKLPVQTCVLTKER